MRKPKTYQYILSTSREMTPEEIAGELQTWVQSRLVSITSEWRPGENMTCQYTLTFSEEVWPRYIADGMTTWLYTHALTITDCGRPEGHKSYGPVYHVSDGLDNVPLSEEGMRTFVAELWKMGERQEDCQVYMRTEVEADQVEAASRLAAKLNHDRAASTCDNYAQRIADGSLVWLAHRKTEAGA